CDGFFQNTCKSPMSCVASDSGKVCAGSCDWGDFGKKYCKDPKLEPVEVEYTRGGTSLGSAGCYCVPRKGGAPAEPSASVSAAASAKPASSTKGAKPKAKPPAPKK